MEYNVNVLITGTNRGIGLGLVKRFLSSGSRVIATAREPGNATELKKLGEPYKDKLMILRLDVSDTDSCRDLGTYLEDESLDLLINNAGVQIHSSGSFLNEAAMNECWQVNTLGPLRIIETVLPALKRGHERKIVNISTVLSSIRNAGADNMPYRVTKAALNMATRIYSGRLSSEGFCVVALHPGWVRTDMGGPAAPTSVLESAEAIFNVIATLTPGDSGRFIHALSPENDINW